MDCYHFNPNDIAPLFVLIFVALVMLFYLVVLLIKTWINCMIFHKAGYKWAWGLLTLVPIANIILPFVLELSIRPCAKSIAGLKRAAKTQTT